MINKNNEEFFSDLDKALPSSSYTERFKEELANHLDDGVDENIQKGFDPTKAQEKAFSNIGNINKLSTAYIKYLRPDLLLYFYFESLLVGSIAAIFCLGYFFLSITSFFREQAGDPNSWVAWVFYIVIPFLFFLIFYLLSLVSTLKKNPISLRLRLISIIAILPVIVILGVAMIAQGTERGDIYFPIFRHAIVALTVSYAAFGFAVYILIRGLKTIPPLLAKIIQYTGFLFSILAELYLLASSIVPHLYPQAGWLYLFLSLREQIDVYLETALGIGIHLTNNVMYEVWIFGLLFAIIAAFCLISLGLYVYSRKRKSLIKFPGFKLILLTYIVLLFIVPPARNWKLLNSWSDPMANIVLTNAAIEETPINWLRPVVNVIEVIEKKQTGPFYYWFLNLFKNKGGFAFSSTNIVDDNFIIHREGPDYIDIIKNIRSVHDFDVETQALNQEDILKLQQQVAVPSSLLEQGFACITPNILKYPDMFLSSNSRTSICTSLAYKTVPIFSGDTPYAIFSTLVDSQKKWALIGLTEMNADVGVSWLGSIAIYLIQLP